MSFLRRGIRLLLVIACLAVLSTGCATSKGSYQVTSPPPEQTALSKYSEICVEVSCSQGLSLTPSDLDRMKGLIVQSVPTECSNQFKCMDQPTPGSNAILAKVKITQYDEGNAFARWMLAGLGQMHIDAEVVLNDYTAGDELLRSQVTKTFAWGGLYGATTQITNIEDGFAKAVAASFTGKNTSQ
jgi:hypothetical protein